LDRLGGEGAPPELPVCALGVPGEAAKRLQTTPRRPLFAEPVPQRSPDRRAWSSLPDFPVCGVDGRFPRGGGAARPGAFA
jgi:hypothetical protein